LDSSHKWKSGIVLGKDGKVLFIKYSNFIRQVPLDKVVPADEFQDTSEEEPDKDDVANCERLEDDGFHNAEIVAQKEKEIDKLVKCNLEQRDLIEELKGQIPTEKKPEPVAKVTKPKVNLPNLFQRIRLKVAGNKDDETLMGKVMVKQKPTSKHRNILGIRLSDGSEKEYDFSKDVTEWVDIREQTDEIPDPCCLHSLSDSDGEIMHETYATVLTKAQVRQWPVEAKKAMEEEIKKFESFGAFNARWVFTEHQEHSKGYKLKSRLCMCGDKEPNSDN
jgi:hypothetical protein